MIIIIMSERGKIGGGRRRQCLFPFFLGSISIRCACVYKRDRTIDSAMKGYDGVKILLQMFMDGYGYIQV